MRSWTDRQHSCTQPSACTISRSRATAFPQYDFYYLRDRTTVWCGVVLCYAASASTSHCTRLSACSFSASGASASCQCKMASSSTIPSEYKTCSRVLSFGGSYSALSFCSLRITPHVEYFQYTHVPKRVPASCSDASAAFVPLGVWTTGTYSTNFTANSTKATSTFGVSSKGRKSGAYVSTAAFGFSILAGVKHAWKVNSSAACQPRRYRVRCLMMRVKPVQQIQHCSDANRCAAAA